MVDPRARAAYIPCRSMHLVVSNPEGEMWDFVKAGAGIWVILFCLAAWLLVIAVIAGGSGVH